MELISRTIIPRRPWKVTHPFQCPDPRFPQSCGLIRSASAVGKPRFSATRLWITSQLTSSLLDSLITREQFKSLLFENGRMLKHNESKLVHWTNLRSIVILFISINLSPTQNETPVSLRGKLRNISSSLACVITSFCFPILYSKRSLFTVLHPRYIDFKVRWHSNVIIPHHFTFLTGRHTAISIKSLVVIHEQ
jgi:hypothetical protein